MERLNQNSRARNSEVASTLAPAADAAAEIHSKKFLRRVRSQTFAGYSRSYFRVTDDGAFLIHYVEPRGKALWRARRFAEGGRERHAA